MTHRRSASQRELVEVVEYWNSLGRASNYVDESSLISFLQIFTPAQIKGAMYITQSTGREAYFRYFCGVIHNWRRQLEAGEEPSYFEVDE